VCRYGVWKLLRQLLYDVVVQMLLPTFCQLTFLWFEGERRGTENGGGRGKASERTAAEKGNIFA
jgi:hypothetical protein